MRHTTTYTYDAVVTDSLGLAHLVPRDGPRQRVTAYVVEVAPTPGDTSTGIDHHGNLVTFFQVDQPHRELVVEGRGEVEVTAPLPEPSAEAARWESLRPLDHDSGRAPLEAVEMALASPSVPVDPDATAYAAPSFVAGRPVGAVVDDLVARVHADFGYDPTSTTVTSTVAEVLVRRSGVCQDFAHLLLAGLRGHGLAARYVSGYLATDPPPGRDRVVGADASHAWVEVWLGHDVWLAVDPTNAVRVTDRHVRVAQGRDYGDVAPLKGVIVTRAARSSLSVSVDVEPLDAGTRHDPGSLAPS